MEPVDGGGTTSSAAAREAARRAAEAARQRLIELNTMDGYQASPTTQAFSAPVQAAPLATPAAVTYSPSEAALLAASPAPSAPPSLLSPQDQSELALLAHCMEEHGAAPAQVQHALAKARLVQIERDQRALASVDGAALEAQGRSFELGAQQTLDHYISNVDSIYSGLAPVDRAQAGYLAYEQNATAKGLTYQALVIETQSAGLDLERAILERQLAVEAGAPASSLAVFDARIADARQLIDGAPAVTLQIQDLERRLDILRKGAELYDPNRPPDWRTQFAKNEAALQAQIAELRLQEVGHGSRVRPAGARILIKRLF